MHYRAKTTFGFFRFQANLSEASAPIIALGSRDDYDDEADFGTPFQTADARHDEMRAALLLLDYFGSDYWLDPTIKVTKTDDGEMTYGGMPRSDYIRSLLVSVEAEPEEIELPARR